MRRLKPSNGLQGYHMRHVLIVVLLTVWPLSAWADTRLRFCYDHYPPYAFGSEDQPSSGLKVRLLQEIVAQIDGVSADVTIMPWKRCQAAARTGEVDGILPLFKSAEREAYLAFSAATFQETSRFFYNRARFPGGLDWDGDLADLSHLRLGMLNGGVIDPDMEAAFSANQDILRARDARTLMPLLVKDRVDLIATDTAVGRMTIRQNGWGDQLTYVEHPIAERASFFGLSRTSGADRYRDAFNRAVEAMTARGRIAEILQEAGEPQN